MLTTEQQRIVEKYHYVIYAFLSKYSLPADDYYDLAAIGLCRAAQSHDPARGCTFFSYAWLCIRGEIGTEYRKQRHRIKAMSIETTERDDGTAYLPDTIPDPAQGEQIQDIEALEIITKLEPPEQRAVCLALQSMSLSECAGIMQLSPITYCTIRETAYEKLRHYFTTGAMKPLNAAQLAQVQATAKRLCKAEKKRERDMARIDTSTAAGVYYLNHLDEKRATSRAYYYAHRTELQDKHRKWKDEHREEINAKRRAQYQEHKAREREAVLCTA